MKMQRSERWGRYYYNARWYDPELGRFVTEDPIRDGQNWFVYASNNPLKYVDPSGLINIENSEIIGSHLSKAGRAELDRTGITPNPDIITNEHQVNTVRRTQNRYEISGYQGKAARDNDMSSDIRGKVSHLPGEQLTWEKSIIDEEWACFFSGMLNPIYQNGKKKNYPLEDLANVALSSLNQGWLSSVGEVGDNYQDIADLAANQFDSSVTVGSAMWDSSRNYDGVINGDNYRDVASSQVDRLRGIMGDNSDYLIMVRHNAEGVDPHWTSYSTLDPTMFNFIGNWQNSSEMQVDAFKIFQILGTE